MRMDVFGDHLLVAGGEGIDELCDIVHGSSHLLVRPDYFMLAATGSETNGRPIAPVVPASNPFNLFHCCSI